MSFEDYLDQSCDIEEYSESQDEYGEISRSWSTKESSVPTRYRRARKERELDVGDEDYRITIEDFVFWFLPQVEIGKEDRLVVNDKVFKVITPPIMDSSRHHQKVFGRRINS